MQPAADESPLRYCRGLSCWRVGPSAVVPTRRSGRVTLQRNRFQYSNGGSSPFHDQMLSFAQRKCIQQWLIISLIISCRNKGCGYGGWCVSSDLAASAAVRAPHSYLCGLGCCYTAISVTSYYGRARVPLQGRRKLRSFLAARPGTSPVRCSSRRAPSDATGNWPRPFGDAGRAAHAARPGCLHCSYCVLVSASDRRLLYWNIQLYQSTAGRF